MGVKVMLPEFNFPDQTPHPAVRALWLAGGLVVVATVVLGGALWHRHTVDQAARAAATQAIAATQRSIAEATAPAAVPAPAVALAAAPASAAATPAEAPAAAPPKAEHVTRRRAHRGARSMKGHTVARADHGSRKSPAKRDDAVDRLLRSFK